MFDHVSSVYSSVFPLNSEKTMDHLLNMMKHHGKSPIALQEDHGKIMEHPGG